MNAQRPVAPAIATVLTVVGIIFLVRKLRHRPLSRHERARLAAKRKATACTARARARRVAEAATRRATA